MSATPVLRLVSIRPLLPVRAYGTDAHASPFTSPIEVGYVRFGDLKRTTRVVPSWLERQRTFRAATIRSYIQRSALDIGRPGLFDQLDHGLRHRNVVELLGHLAALGKCPSEELDGFRGCRLLDGLLVHQDEGRGRHRPRLLAGLIGED